MLSGLWPNFDSVAKKCQKVFGEYKNGKDIMGYQTNGQEERRAHETMKKSMKTQSISPSKTQAMTGSQLP